MQGSDHQLVQPVPALGQRIGEGVGGERLPDEQVRRQVEGPADGLEYTEVEGPGHAQEFKDPHLVRSDVLKKPLNDLLRGAGVFEAGGILQVGVDREVQIERDALAGFGDGPLPRDLGDTGLRQEVQPGLHRQAVDVHTPDHRVPFGVVDRPPQRLAAGEDREAALELAQQVAEPGIGPVAAPAGEGRRHQRVVGVHIHGERFRLGRGAQVLREEIGDRVPQLRVAEVVQLTQGRIGLHPVPALAVLDRASGQTGETGSRTEHRQTHRVVEDLGEDVALFRERRVL